MAGAGLPPTEPLNVVFEVVPPMPHTYTQHNTTQQNTTQHNTTQHNTTQQQTKYNTRQHICTPLETVVGRDEVRQQNLEKERAVRERQDLRPRCRAVTMLLCAVWCAWRLAVGSGAAGVFRVFSVVSGVVCVCVCTCVCVLPRLRCSGKTILEKSSVIRGDLVGTNTRTQNTTHKQARTHEHTYTHTHAHTHAHTGTHTQTQAVVNIGASCVICEDVVVRSGDQIYEG